MITLPTIFHLPHERFDKTKLSIHQENAENFIFFFAYYGNDEVGNLNCFILSSSQLRIQDVQVKDTSPPGRPVLKVFPKKKMNFRKRGIGTLLIESLITYAKNNGYSEITGEVVKLDYEYNQQLPAWYAKKGFDILPTNPAEGSKVLYRLRLAVSF